MQYYNIDSIKNEYPEVHEHLKELFSYNDAFFLTNIYGYGETISSRETYFRDILMMFYDCYTGDRQGWLQHTMSIVYCIPNDYVYLWLELELQNSITDRIPTKKEIFTRYYLSGIIHRRGDESLDKFFTQMVLDHGGSIGYYNKLWKMANKNN